MASSMVHVYTRRKANDNKSHGIGARYKGVENKEQKVFVIANADAIVDPVWVWAWVRNQNEHEGKVSETSIHIA